MEGEILITWEFVKLVHTAHSNLRVCVSILI